MKILQEIDNKIRNELKIGMTVDIVLKKDQRTGTLTRGKIKKILSPGGFHSRGIKVKLEDDQVGRVVTVINN